MLSKPFDKIDDAFNPIIFFELYNLQSKIVKNNAQTFIVPHYNWYRFDIRLIPYLSIWGPG